MSDDVRVDREAVNEIIARALLRSLGEKADANVITVDPGWKGYPVDKKLLQGEWPSPEEKSSAGDYIIRMSATNNSQNLYVPFDESKTVGYNTYKSYEMEQDAGILLGANDLHSYSSNSFRDRVRGAIYSTITNPNPGEVELAADRIEGLGRDVSAVDAAIRSVDEAAANAWRASVSARAAFGKLEVYLATSADERSVAEENALRATWLAAVQEEERLSQIALAAQRGFVEKRLSQDSLSKQM